MSGPLPRAVRAVKPARQARTVWVACALAESLVYSVPRILARTHRRGLGLLRSGINEVRPT
jgi:hypothetical protein